MNNDYNIASIFKEAEQVYLSVTILGELYYGAENSTKKSKNLQAIQNILNTGITILEITKETAQIYGRLHKQLRDKGRPIPQNDMWIASTALQYGLTLVTKDNHFSEVDNLTLLDW